MQIRIKTHSSLIPPHFGSIPPEEVSLLSPAVVWPSPHLAVHLHFRGARALDARRGAGLTVVQRRTTCIMTTKESPRLQTASAAFLSKQSKNMVTPFVLATLSRRAHRFGGGRVGVGALDPLVLFPDNVSETVLHLAASTQGPERSATFVTQWSPFPPVH